MDLEDFRNSPAGRLIKVGQGKTAYWAFAPHPLPPDLPLDWELVGALTAAEHALGELSGVGRAMPNPHLLIGPFMRREAVLSSRIEGTQADIADLYAYEAGQSLLYLSAYFYHYRQDYYDLLLAVSEKGSWREWVLFFLHGVTEQAQDAIGRGQRLQDLQADWHERLAQARASALLLRLADALFESPIITIPEAKRLLDVTYPSAQHNVEKLVKAGILDSVDNTSYRRTYRAVEILEIVEQGDRL